MSILFYAGGHAIFYEEEQAYRVIALMEWYYPASGFQKPIIYQQIEWEFHTKWYYFLDKRNSAVRFGKFKIQYPV